MVTWNHVIVLPDDPNAAGQQLAGMLIDPAQFIYLFLFGAGNDIADFVQTANAMAGPAHRRVVWSKTLTPAAPAFSGLATGDGVPPITTAGTIGFSLSGHLVVADTIVSGDPLDFGRAASAFILAEGLS